MKLQDYVSSSGAIDVAGANEENVKGFGHDYRELGQRREGFLQFYAVSVAIGDCDPALWLMRYLRILGGGTVVVLVALSHV